MAPFITYQMGQLKSMFVKFSQSIGSRVDIVPMTWSREMSRLHDACPPSSEYHVRHEIETEFSLFHSSTLLSTKNSIFSNSTNTTTNNSTSNNNNTPTTTSITPEVSVSPSLSASHISSSPSSSSSSSTSTATATITPSGRYTSSSSPSLSPSSSSSPSSSASRVAIEDIFETFDMTPIASASIGQVHTATLKSPVTGEVVPVVVKVQHHDIARIMWSDVIIAGRLIQIASFFDSRWEVLGTALRGWKKTMQDELDFRVEARNLLQVGNSLRATSLDAEVPEPIEGLISRTVLVMTRLEGFKVTDKLALNILSVDRRALVCRIAHCCAKQLLVDGLFNADPHAGNLMFMSSRRHPGSCCPGLLDFGMTVRLEDNRRQAYCRLLIAIYEGDSDAATAALKEVGYSTNQSSRVPGRDAEAFEFLFRDATPRKQAMKETSSFFDLRKNQKNNDIKDGTREKAGRNIENVPEDLLFLIRVVGLLRGLTADLEVSCPILHILSLHARVGLYKTCN
mmetsp:Transcript_30354/g.30851  ORF Transcript_30354/g.30851 Transcript_30354/m.30851 type:complete len:510 (+) Transcript_30354:135-1664(+)|eukprot:CAMPEP_0182426680 /NCGR_PEP_ID=MMETSP1167-20130531/13192_1 /TAXON_ID=2988 /ORGANISM="Mallomonas Sp, Strain CCMP3275" /LENGTH=509 /DNA_ID=CAMNT_0024608295 /DNA_START=70 /DNA_END=1599 /DNA_ORIENTATION=+